MESDKSWNSFYSVITSNLASHYYGSIRQLYLHTLSIEYGQWFSLTRNLTGLQLLSLEQVKLSPIHSSKIDFNHQLATMQCLKEMVISDCSRLILTPMILLFQRAPRIRKLSVTGSDFNEGDLCSMVSFCNNLTDITLGIEQSRQNGRDLAGGDTFASALIRHCPRIQCLDLTGLLSLSDTGFVALIKAYGPRLRKLQLRKAPIISTYALSQIAILCNGSTLKKLSFGATPGLTDRVLELIMTETATSLEFLQLDSVEITDKGARAVARHGKSLRQLRMYDLKNLTDISFISDREAVPLLNLRQLILHGSPDITEVHDLENLGAPQLERLELVGCYCIDEQLMRKMIRHFSQLSRFIYVGGHASPEFQKVFSFVIYLILRN